MERLAARPWFIECVAISAESTDFDQAMRMDEVTRRAFLLARSRMYPEPAET